MKSRSVTCHVRIEKCSLILKSRLVSWPLSEKNVQNSTTQDTDNFSKHTESIGINQTFAKTVSSNVLYSFPQYRISFIYVRVCV